MLQYRGTGSCLLVTHTHTAATTICLRSHTFLTAAAQTHRHTNLELSSCIHTHTPSSPREIICCPSFSLMKAGSDGVCVLSVTISAALLVCTSYLSQVTARTALLVFSGRRLPEIDAPSSPQALSVSARLPQQQSAHKPCPAISVRAFSVAE